MENGSKVLRNIWRRSSAYMTNLSGHYEGPSLAHNLGFNAVEVNIDSKIILDTLNDKKVSSVLGRSLVGRIWRLIELNWQVVVHHSYHERNQYADALASVGSSLSTDISYF
ncbi:ethylene responsive transcription factor 1b [Trifolium pratense]|uniref:Ethylene responsive transcription factor 1b n=1 Tax=Trifolium pratense TaxID=57577 RepID=A0A2K3MFR3_TRIPR|nr:ethylene responsive transcription factor 1b [Trifolium pratense]